MSSFRPVIDSNLNKVGTVQKYNALTGQAKSIPFMKSQNLDVGDYVTNKALDGLFKVVAEEEKRHPCESSRTSYPPSEKCIWQLRRGATRNWAPIKALPFQLEWGAS